MSKSSLYELFAMLRMEILRVGNTVFRRHSNSLTLHEELRSFFHLVKTMRSIDSHDPAVEINDRQSSVQGLTMSQSEELPRVYYLSRSWTILSGEGQRRGLFLGTRTSYLMFSHTRRGRNDQKPYLGDMDHRTQLQICGILPCESFQLQT